MFFPLLFSPGQTRSTLVIIFATTLCVAFLIFEFNNTELFHKLPYNSWRSRNSLNGSYEKSPTEFESFFPPPDPSRKDYHQWNEKTLRELHSCLLLSSCGQNQTSVAILGAHWFQEAIVTGFRGGEGIWGISVYENLREMGYTTFFATNFEECLDLYRMMPTHVKVVIRNKAGECHSDPECVKGPSNPTGIPAWKIFDFEYFPSYGNHYHASLMRGPWILSADISPEKERPHPPQYLGYSVENECKKYPVIPLAERANTVWIHMKQLTYIYSDTFAWNKTYFPLAAKELGLTFTGGWQVDQHYQWDPDTQGELIDFEDREHGVINLGKLDADGFEKVVSNSKAFLGIGAPWWSPSGYNALCQGVPVINPIMSWDHNSPNKKENWYMTQHPSLSLLDPPYVYNVFAHDYEGFVNAIKLATTTPIESYIPERMTNAALKVRLSYLMETDWKEKAAVLLEERIKGGWTFEL